LNIKTSLHDRCRDGQVVDSFELQQSIRFRWRSRPCNIL